MSTTHLPDDLAQWPENPHEILGVDPGIGRRELRQAYVRLIRVYKPEHFPEHFRRIREAFESIDGFLQYCEHNDYKPSPTTAFSLLETPQETTDSGDVTEDVTENEPTDDLEHDSTGRRPIEERTSFQKPIDEIATAWQWAKRGEYAEAYLQLRELGFQRSFDAAICARLYWLLTLQPSLDKVRDRRDWLVLGLESVGYDDTLMELYTRELEGDPSEVLRPRCQKLVTQSWPFHRRAFFAANRWVALGYLKRLDVILQDLNVLRSDATVADHIPLARLILTASEHLLWQKDVDQALADIAFAFRREVYLLSEAHLELANDLDRNDYFIELVGGLRELLKASRCDDSLFDLLHRAWFLPFDSVRQQLLEYFRPAAEHPRKALAVFGNYQRLGSVVLHQLNNHAHSLYWSRYDSDSGPSDEELAEATKEFLRLYYMSEYSAIREDILFFCIRHRTLLRRFHETAESVYPTFSQSPWPGNLTNDLPLQCVIAACLAFVE